MLRRTLLVAAVTLALAACGQGAEKADGTGPLIVGATAVPHAEILEFLEILKF